MPQRASSSPHRAGLQTLHKRCTWTIADCMRGNARAAVAGGDTRLTRRASDLLAMPWNAPPCSVKCHMSHFVLHQTLLVTGRDVKHTGRQPVCTRKTLVEGTATCPAWSCIRRFLLLRLDVARAGWQPACTPNWQRNASDVQRRKQGIQL